MFANKKLWFKVAGICVGAGIALMVVAFFLVGGDLHKLQSPLPVGISVVDDGVRVASDQLPAVPEPPQAPAAPAAPKAPAAPSASAALASAEAPAAFDTADKLALANRALAHVLDLLI